MTSPNWFVLVVLSLFALLGAAGVVWEVLARRKAGPVRFRLPLASLEKPTQMPAWRKILFMFCMLMVLSPAFTRGTPPDLLALTFCLWLVADYLQAVHARRQTIRWLVLASGLISLVVAALLLSIGLGVFQPSLFGMPPWAMLILSAFLFAGGAATIWEGLSGTLVREHGLEIFGAIHPWRRIVVKNRQECDGGFALGLSILSPRIFGMPFRRAIEMILPIPPAQRPAFEAFLAGRAAAAD